MVITCVQGYWLQCCVHKQKTGNNLKVSQYRIDWMCGGHLLAANSSPSVSLFLANRNPISFRYPFSRKGDMQPQPQGKPCNSLEWKRLGNLWFQCGPTTSKPYELRVSPSTWAPCSHLPNAHSLVLPTWRFFVFENFFLLEYNCFTMLS